ncbi:MAG: peptidyl-prolyl cis-trans isomerase [Bacteroidaceae bacterium]|nr:peptidyl-prolyl cis-trans isomerase [Bacteroidaceae bacterium]
MRIKILKYKVQRALQLILLCLFSFSVLPTIYAQSDIELMARAARSEGLDKEESFQRNIETFKVELAGKFLFEDQQTISGFVSEEYDRVVAAKGNRQMLIRQIFHALPQHIMTIELSQWQQRMDSISNAIAGGADFESLVNSYSDVRIPEWLSRFDMIDEMEKVLIDMHPNQISAPFLSSLGIHIVQLLDEREVDIDIFKSQYMQRVKQLVFPYNLTQQQIANIKADYSFSENKHAVAKLYREGTVDDALFSLDGKHYTGEQFAAFAQAYNMSIPRQYEAFVLKCLLDCQASHLDNNLNYTQTVQDYANRLLAQEAYNKHVRIPSSTDEIGLKAYFSAHQKDYRWQMPKFKGAIIHAVDKKTAKKVRKVLKKMRNSNWAEVEKHLGDKILRNVFVEQGVYALGSNPFVDELEFKNGHADPLPNYPVTLIVGKKINGPEDYNEVRSQLMQDYEHYQSKEWLSALRKQK